MLAPKGTGLVSPLPALQQQLLQHGWAAGAHVQMSERELWSADLVGGNGPGVVPLRAWGQMRDSLITGVQAGAPGRGRSGQPAKSTQMITAIYEVAVSRHYVLCT